MGKSARKFAEKNFDIKTVVNTHLRIYEELINKKIKSYL